MAALKHTLALMSSISDELIKSSNSGSSIRIHNIWRSICSEIKLGNNSSILWSETDSIINKSLNEGVFSLILCSGSFIKFSTFLFTSSLNSGNDFANKINIR